MTFPLPSSMGRKLLSYRSVICVLFVCFLANSLRKLFFPPLAPPDYQLELDDSPTAPYSPSQNYFPGDTKELQPTPLGTHQYGDDGLLVVNPDGPHPIFELTQRAEEAWAKKLDCASKSLGEAVAEYQRRYHRPPPLHFDKWWDYVVKHDVQLPDEYDEIHHDLEPFWGIDPLDFQKTREQLETQSDTVVVEKTDRNPYIEIVHRNLPPGSEDRLTKSVYNLFLLLEDVEDFVLPFRAVFSPHDNPSMLSDYGVRSGAIAAAATGSTLKRSELPKARLAGWLSACPPSSPAWRYLYNLDDPPKRSSRKTFISDHRLSMDPCLNPHLLHSHGQFLSHNMGPGPQSTLVPRFSFCSTLLHHDIRPATPYGWMEDVLPRAHDPPWEEKVEERLVWRGSNTGIFHGVNTRWRDAHRDRLIHYSNNMAGTVDVLRSPLNGSERVGEPIRLRKAHVNPELFDIQFSGKPGSCSPKLCDELEKLYDWRKSQSIKEAGRYKYVLDVDGNGWSGRFKRLITSNSLVFKSTIYPEWFTDRIAPWVHYVPVQVDRSDLYDTLTFFRGGLGGEGAHDDMARKIATAGREWSKKYWRQEDLTAYMFRLFLEYARVSSLDRDAMTYKGDHVDDLE